MNRDAYLEANRVKIAAQRRIRYYANHEKIKAQKRAWNRENRAVNRDGINMMRRLRYAGRRQLAAYRFAMENC